MASTPQADVESEVQIRIRQQEVIAELGQQALEADDLDQLMHDAVAAVAETLNNEYAKVLELLPGEDEVFLRQGIGWRDGLVGNSTVPTDLDSQAGYTLLSEKPIVVDDLRTEERFSGPELLTSHDVVSGISVIIGSVEEPWGVLGTHTTEKREFTEYDASFVQSVANVFALAIENTQTERRFEAIFEDPNILVGLLEPDGTVVDINDTAMEYIDATLSDVTGELFWETPWWGNEDGVQSDVKEWTKRAAAGEYVDFETDHTRPNGERYTLSGYFRPVRDADGEVVSIIVSDRDVTEHKEYERKLELFRTLLDETNDSVLVIDPHTGTFLDVNETACRRFGYNRSELLELSVPDMERRFDDIEDWRSHVEDVKTEDAVTIEGVHERKDGTTYPAEVNVTHVELDREYMVGVARDITERKNREQELKESNERLEQFAYATSHDLQEPLRMVSSYLQLIESRYADELDEEGKEFLEFAVDGADRMREMINALLKYSRVETCGDLFEPVDLDVVFDGALEDLRLQIKESNAEITAKELPHVKGDASQLRQVFQNLLSNAITYSGDAQPRIRVEADRRNGECVIAVHDNGIGIDPDNQAHVFEVFQRLHTHEEHSGTGIGLALCQRIIERHGGEIWVDSEPGEGSKFSFTLPAVDLS